jgi:primosomal protein N' (replication factor Y)
MTAARERVLETATGCLGWTRSGLAHAAGVSLSVVDGLTKAGVFEEIELPPCTGRRDAGPGFCGRGSVGRAAEAAEALRAPVEAGGFSGRRCSTA